jgi:hypothetical protein
MKEGLRQSARSASPELRNRYRFDGALRAGLLGRRPCDNDRKRRPNEQTVRATLERLLVRMHLLDISGRAAKKTRNTVLAYVV